jgi:integrative and conjugative element protein (TIGR02256 family)
MSTTALKFRTPDVRFGLSMDELTMGKILELCREAANVETGGILVGHYTKNHDWAIVTAISGPPKDSRRANASFFRGVKGLQKWLKHIWGSKRHFYLGEWHYHPFAKAVASSVDAEQLKEHSENKPLMCPEPVMLIVGGNPNGLWEAKAYVCPEGKGLFPMDKLEPMSATPCQCPSARP